MFGIFFSIVVTVVLLSICGDIVVRVRVTRIETLLGEKMAW